MSQNSFLYTVHPRKLITDLKSTNIPIRVSKSLMLTKEDVYTCLKKASVYRRFSPEGVIERVTIGNIDRLHNDKYYTEEEWNKKIKENATKTNRGTVVSGTNSSISNSVIENTYRYPGKFVVADNEKENSATTDQETNEESNSNYNDSDITVGGSNNSEENMGYNGNESDVVLDDDVVNYVEDTTVSKESAEFEADNTEDLDQVVQTEPSTKKKESEYSIANGNQKQNNGNRHNKYNTKKYKGN